MAGNLPRSASLHPLFDSFPFYFMNIERFTLSDRRQIPQTKDNASIAFYAHPQAGLQVVRNEEAALDSQPAKLRLGHVHLKVRDLSSSLPFYTEILGLNLTERVGRYAFLALGEEHHSLALEEIGQAAASSSQRALGVEHIAFEAPDRKAFNAMQNLLRAAKLPFLSSNNGTNWALDFRDPDGHEIQVYVDRRHSPGGAKLWRGRWYGPLKTEAFLSLHIPQ